MAITENAYGPDHPDVAIRLTNLAVTLHSQGRPEAAVPLLERALTLTENALGPDHPQAVAIRVTLGPAPPQPGPVGPGDSRKPSGTSG